MRLSRYQKGCGLIVYFFGAGNRIHGLMSSFVSSACSFSIQFDLFNFTGQCAVVYNKIVS